MPALKRSASMIMLAVILAPSGLHAQQEVLGAIRKITAAYAKDYAIGFTGNIKMYLKSNPDKIVETMQSRYVINDSLFTCAIGPVQMLLNDQYYVSVDRSVKIMIIGHRKDLAGTERLPALNLQQYEKRIREKTIEARLVNGNRHSLLRMTDIKNVTGYRSYEISFDALSGYMQTVLLEAADYTDPLNKTMVLRIDYTRPARIPAGSDSFSERSFFTLEKGIVKVNKKYREYQLVNQL